MYVFINNDLPFAERSMLRHRWRVPSCLNCLMALRAACLPALFPLSSIKTQFAIRGDGALHPTTTTDYKRQCLFKGTVSRNEEVVDQKDLRAVGQITRNSKL
jgi:hypothetical protein